MSEVKDQQVRKRIYKNLIDAFEDEDCDTLYECEGADPAFDKAMEESR